MNTRRRTEPPPSMISDEVLRRVADFADRVGISIQREQPKDKRHTEYNQLAHWLWRVAGVEPSDLEPENAAKIRARRRP